MNVEPVIVGGREIPAEAIAAEAQHHPAKSADAAFAAAAEALVIRQLLLDEADRHGIAAAELTDAKGRRLVDDDARIEVLLERELKVPQADDATCRRFYERHPQRFTTPMIVEAEHILFAASPDDPIAYGMAVSDARNVIRTIEDDPAAFAVLAREHSACPSGAQGGNLGQIGPGQTVDAFERALFALGEGELCREPVKTRFGVHVVRAGRKSEGVRLPFEAVRDRIAGYLEEASYRRAVAQYVAILASRAGVRGVAIASADGPLVQ